VFPREERSREPIEAGDQRLQTCAGVGQRNEEVEGAQRNGEVVAAGDHQ
jgi:hypothetical protein